MNARRSEVAMSRCRSLRAVDNLVSQRPTHEPGDKFSRTAGPKIQNSIKRSTKSCPSVAHGTSSKRGNHHYHPPLDNKQYIAAADRQQQVQDEHLLRLVYACLLQHRLTLQTYIGATILLPPIEQPNSKALVNRRHSPLQ